MYVLCFFFFKQKTAYEMRISDWSSDVCSSDLLDSDREAATVLADELFPARGHAAMEPGMEIRVLGNLDGIEIRFRSRVIAINPAQAGASYTLVMPVAVDYKQRRNAFRVPVSPALAIPVLLHADGINAKGTLADISPNGLRVAMRNAGALTMGSELLCEKIGRAHV